MHNVKPTPTRHCLLLSVYSSIYLSINIYSSIYLSMIYLSILGEEGECTMFKQHHIDTVCDSFQFIYLCIIYLSIYLYLTICLSIYS